MHQLLPSVLVFIYMERKRSHRLRQNPHTCINRRGLHRRPFIDRFPACRPPEHKTNTPLPTVLVGLSPRLTEAEETPDSHIPPPNYLYSFVFFFTYLFNYLDIFINNFFHMSFLQKLCMFHLIFLFLICFLPHNVQYTLDKIHFHCFRNAE